MPELCDKLGLNLLINSEDMSYHFKFVEVVQNTCNKYIDDGDGNIDFGKFMKWWNMTIEELMTKDEQIPTEEQPVEEPKK